MFSCGHPRVPEEAQVALMLHILCGFSVDEVAAAFVSSRDAMEKRILRAKKVLAGSRRLFDVLSAGDRAVRLLAVQRAVYLLFNEGYHGASSESAVRVAVLVSKLVKIPGVVVKRKPTSANLTVKKRVFAFTTGDRVVLKLSP